VYLARPPSVYIIKKERSGKKIYQAPAMVQIRNCNCKRHISQTCI